MNRLLKLLIYFLLIIMGAVAVALTVRTILKLATGPEPGYSSLPAATTSASDAGGHAAALWIIFGGSSLLAVPCLIRVWRRSNSVFERIFWSLYVFFPVIGPLFFVVFFRPPPELPDGEKASVNESAFYGGGGLH